MAELESELNAVTEQTGILQDLHAEQLLEMQNHVIQLNNQVNLVGDELAQARLGLLLGQQSAADFAAQRVVEAEQARQLLREEGDRNNLLTARLIKEIATAGTDREQLQQDYNTAGAKLSSAELTIDKYREDIRIRRATAKSAKVEAERQASIWTVEIHELKKSRDLLLKEQIEGRAVRAEFERQLMQYRSWEAQSPSRTKLERKSQQKVPPSRYR